MADEKKTRPQDRWDAKAGVEICGYKLHIDIAKQFKEACKTAGTSQAKALDGLMKKFIAKVNEQQNTQRL